MRHADINPSQPPSCTGTVHASGTRVPTLNPDQTTGTGFFRVEVPLSGTAVLTPEGIDSQITATEAAALCGVALCTITKWAREERILPVGMNRQGRKLYRLLDIAKAERATRDRARR